MTSATGIGSLPGEDYPEAVRIVLGELPELPHVPELPARGAVATMVGRAVAMVSELAFDLQPAGWRLTGSVGVDQRRARSLLAQDLDQVEEQAQAHRGGFKTQVTGPWTLAATVERPRGDRLLADHGARRELAQALADGAAGHVADLRRRLPGVDRLVVQVDEPALAAVVAGRVPTASGLGRHRAVDLPEASAHLGWLFEAVRDAGAEPWVHACAPRTPTTPPTPWSLVAGAGGGIVEGLAADIGTLGAEDLETFAEHLEAGRTVALGVVPTDPSHPDSSQADPLSDRDLVDQVLRWLDLLGLDPEQHAEQLVLTPACGLAGVGQERVRTVLTALRTAAQQLG